MDPMEVHFALLDAKQPGRDEINVDDMHMLSISTIYAV
jgi:hypothetical protein